MMIGRLVVRLLVLLSYLALGACALPQKSTVDSDPRSMGSPSSPVAIVEYSDYQCPYCRQFHAEVLPQLRERYIQTGKVLYFFRDYPLAQHHESYPAAIAARCAADQGKFWAMNEALFANQQKLGTDLYPRIAQALGLDGERFGDCMRNPETRRRVQGDARTAAQYGVGSTPTLLLGRYNGERMEVEKMSKGVADFAALEREIETLLESKAP